ncbi:MAG: tyrosine-type recombinase/integrase, partial [Solibacillus sp.]
TNNNLKEITPHGFRHTFATILINNGVPVTTIAKMLGNTAKMVMEVYSHSFEENEKRAAQVIEDVMKFA